MKVVTFWNKEWEVYEGRNEFKLYRPNTDLRLCFGDTEEGDYVESTTGFIVPCLKRKHYVATIRDKYKYDKYYFQFPKVKTFVYKNKLHTKPFYYPTNSSNLVPVDPYNQDVMRRPQVKLFAAGMREGLPIEVSYINAFGKYDKTQAGYLLQHKSVIQYIFNDNDRIKTMRRELEEVGITKISIAEKIKDILEEAKPNPNLLKWALETSIKLLEDNVANEQSPLLAASILINELPNHNGTRMITARIPDVQQQLDSHEPLLLESE